MKIVLSLLMVLVLATPCMAGGCQDTQDAVGQAMKARNGRVNNTLNTLIPDPEEERGLLFDILGSVNVFGDGFSLGISFPSLQQIIGAACSKAEYMIQDKIREAQNEALNSIPSIGINNPFKVNGNTDYINPLTGKIR